MRSFFFSLLLLAVVTPQAAATAVGYRFAGTVTSALTPPFGITIPAFSSVTGEFYYDTDSTGASNGNSSIYRQNRSSGFVADFGDIHVSTNSYDVIVSDDLPQPSGGTNDVISIVFSSSSDPLPDSPLLVAGTEHSIGQFSVNFHASPSFITDTSLPVVLELGSFQSKLGFLADTPPQLGNIDVVFVITSLVPVPEPPTQGMFALGLLAVSTLVASKTLSHSAGLSVDAPRRHARKRVALTVVELLITIAIVSLLIGLLLPAVQAAREASSRASCSNNLRQIGVALVNYESGQRSLPCGARRQGGFGSSWWVSILPQLEEATLFYRLDLRSVNNGSAILNLQNATLVDGYEIGVMACPSSPLPRLWPIGSVRIMMPSYVGISGSSSHNGFPEQRVSTCCVPKNNGEISAGGVLLINDTIRANEITDGLSRTLAVGECSDSAVDSAGIMRRIDGGFPNGWIMGTSAPGSPPKYGSTFAPPAWNVTTVRYPPNTRNYDEDGIHQNRGANNPLVSAHTCGVNSLLVDGAVRFLADDVDLIVLKCLATRDDACCRP